jgi:hypothetical protein
VNQAFAYINPDCVLIHFVFLGQCLNDGLKGRFTGAPAKNIMRDFVQWKNAFREKQQRFLGDRVIP